jgi:methylated-DNA-protein-cysteine methyltransferase-like protein
LTPINAYARIYAVVRKIPRGRVATYGQVARLAGLAGHARQAGYALSALPHRASVPWQRVVNAQGQVSPRSQDHESNDQRARLEAEKVRFGPDGKIDLKRFQWKPEGG